MKIKKILKYKGISQIELAEMLGISTTALNRIINGNPTVGTLNRIADVLSVEVGDFFDRSEVSLDGDSKRLYICVDGEFTPVGRINL